MEVKNTWTPEVSRIIASSAIYGEFGPLFCILSGVQVSKGESWDSPGLQADMHLPSGTCT